MDYSKTVAVCYNRQTILAMVQAPRDFQTPAPRPVSLTGVGNGGIEQIIQRPPA